MQVSLKQEYKGQLGLHFNHITREFFYTLTQYAYPKYEPEVVKIEEGDEITVRSPHDGSIIIHRVVEFDYESHRRMNMETGTYHQMIGSQPVNGILTNIEPGYWFALFAEGYYADLVKHV